MIWGHDPPRTHEKITGKRVFSCVLFIVHVDATLKVDTER